MLGQRHPFGKAVYEQDGNGNVRVTGPNGFDQLATLVGASPSGNGTPRTSQ